MLQFLRNAYDFIRQYPAILYSVVLVVFLPCVIFWNTFSTVDSFRSALESNIQSQTGIIQDTLPMALAKDFGNIPAMQETIDQIAKRNPGEIENIRVVVKEGKDYKIIAAQNYENVNKKIESTASLNNEMLVADSWSTGADMAGFAVVDNLRYWRLFRPLADASTQQVYALVTADIPLGEIDRLIGAAVWQSYVILAAVIILVLFLIFQHTRLFSYVFLSKKLQEQNKSKDDFIRMATHELRSPVTVIIAYMEALKEELAPVVNDDQKQYIERISISIKNLNDLMSDILEVSHLQQGRTDFAPETIAVGSVVKEIVEGIKRKAEEKGLALTLEGQELPYKINVNAVCFKRIITNLIENSVKYTPAGKVMVSIKSEPAKKRCVVTVQDTGFGISAEGQKRLFEQFYRVKTADNAGIPGTGLGLWMSRQMAQKMKGDILIESIEHIGSRFFVIFPLADK